MNAPWAPACGWDPKMWRLWQEANRDCGGNEVVYPCADCRPEFREAREFEGACNDPEHPSGQLGLDLFKVA